MRTNVMQWPCKVRHMAGAAGPTIDSVGDAFACGSLIEPQVIYVPAQAKVFGVYQGVNCRPWAFTYDPVTKLFSTPVSLGGSGLTADTHGQPLLYIDGDGYLWVFYGCHTTAIYYKKSTNPYDISAWGVEGTVSGYHTYPTLKKIGSTYYIFHRTNNAYPLGWGWRSSSDLTTWGSTTEFILSSVATDAIYAIVRQDTTGQIHIAWCIWDGSIRKNLYYARTADCTTWKKADGTNYSSLPITDLTGELVVNSGTDFLNVVIGDMQFDSNGYPLIIYLQAQNWELARWDGDSWNISTIASTAGHDFMYGLLYVTDDNNLRAFLEFNNGNGKRYAELKEYRSGDGGTNWTFYQTIEKNQVGSLAEVKAGSAGYEVMGCGSAKSKQDVWVW